MGEGKDTKYLFIHGAGGSKSKWRKLFAALPEEKAIYIDLPGRGDVQQLERPTLELYAEYAQEKIAGNMIVVGHSMGGMVGLELAARSDQVKGIVLVNSHYYVQVDEKILQLLKEGVFPEGLFYASYSKSIDQSLLAEEEQEKKKVPVQTAYQDFYACSLYQKGEERMQNLAIPILAVHGDEDRLLPKKAIEEITQFPNVEVEIIKGVGHNAMIEKPDLLLNILETFKQKIV